MGNEVVRAITAPITLPGQIIDAALGGGPNQQQRAQPVYRDNSAEYERRFDEQHRRNQDALAQQRRNNDAAIEQMKDNYSALVDNNKQALSALQDERNQDKDEHAKQLEKQQAAQTELEKQLNQVQKDSEEQKKSFEEKEKKIKEQLDKQIQKLQAQNLKDNKKHEEGMKKIQKKNEKKLNQLEQLRNQDKEQYSKQMEQIANKNRKEIEQLKGDGLQHRKSQIADLIAARIEMYKSKKIETKQVFDQHVKELTQIKTEERRLNAMFQHERSDLNLLNIVLIGITGHGKSTLACRLVGDTTAKCDSGLFKHNDDLVSVTQGIKKRVCKGKWKHDISVVDTPGIFDSKGKDRHHANNLVEFLRGCGGVNAFLLVKTKIPPRFDASFQNVLESLEVLLGREFWKHAILMITHQNSADSKSKPFEEMANKLRDLIRKEINLEEHEGALPVIGVDSFDNWKRPIKELIKVIPKRRFQCTGLRSPLEELKLETENTRKTYEAKKGELDSIKSLVKLANESFIETDEKLKSIQQSNKQKSSPTKQFDLSCIEDEKGEWDINIELPPIQKEYLPESEDEKSESESKNEWNEIKSTENKYELMELGNDDVSLKLQDPKSCKSPEFPVKLDKHDEKYDEFVSTIEKAVEDGDDCFIIVKQTYLKNNSGKEKVESQVISVKADD